MSHPLTITEARDQARRYARVSSSQATDVQVDFLMDQALDEFARDVGGLPKNEYLSIAAKFDTKTNYAIRITVVGGTGAMAATDVLITGTARSDTTGTIVASDFQTTLQAAVGTSMTVSWTNFAFTVDTLDATSITYEAPTTVTYVDARDLLGLTGTPTLSDYSHTGNFPEDCTMEATLPTDAITIERVEWDNHKIYELPRDYFVSPEASGDPQFYNVRGKYIRLYPSPTKQKLFHVEYRGMPEESNEVFQGYQELGLSSITGGTATGLTASKQYYLKISIDGAAQTEKSITTGTNLNWNAIITLLNAQTTGATWSVFDGDIRCTSDLVTEGSSIALAAGTTGNDSTTYNLFDVSASSKLTGFTAFDTAVARSVDLPPEIPVPYHKYIVWLTAAKLLYETQEYDKANQAYAQYRKGVNNYKLDYFSRNTQMMVGGAVSRLPGVTMPS